MVGKSFSAQVMGGQLCYQEPLDAFEGQDVYVTVVARSSFRSPVPPPADGAEVEPPDWMAVETDLHVEMPFPGKILDDAVVIQGEPIRPCIIMPEETMDE